MGSRLVHTVLKHLNYIVLGNFSKFFKVITTVYQLPLPKILVFLNPRCAYASESYCSCPVCMYVCVCMCVHSYLPPHTLESQTRDTNGFKAIQGSF